MKQKSIAALLLISLTAWIAVPSGFAMSVAHVREATLPIHTHVHASQQHHDCCPGLTPKIAISPTHPAAPCGQNHRCCFAPGSEIPPTLVSSKVSPVADANHAAIEVKPFDMQRREPATEHLIALQLPANFSMVARN